MDLVVPESGTGAGVELLEVEHGELHLSDGADGNNNQPAKSTVHGCVYLVVTECVLFMCIECIGCVLVVYWLCFGCVLSTCQLYRRCMLTASWLYVDCVITAY